MDPTGVYNCLKKNSAQRVDNTTQIYKIVKMSFDEQDWKILKINVEK